MRCRMTLEGRPGQGSGAVPRRMHAGSGETAIATHGTLEGTERGIMMTVTEIAVGAIGGR